VPCKGCNRVSVGVALRFYCLVWVAILTGSTCFAFRINSGETCFHPRSRFSRTYGQCQCNCGVCFGGTVFSKTSTNFINFSLICEFVVSATTPTR
jgi:hypothetical protein